MCLDLTTQLHHRGQQWNMQGHIPTPCLSSHSRSLGSLSHASYTTHMPLTLSYTVTLSHGHTPLTCLLHCRTLSLSRMPHTPLTCLLHCRTLSLSRMAIHSKLLHEDTHHTTLFSSEQQDTMTKQFQTFCLPSFWLSLAVLACLFWNSECEGQAVHLSFLSSPIFRVYITHVCLVFVFICVIN